MSKMPSKIHKVFKKNKMASETDKILFKMNNKWKKMPSKVDKISFEAEKIVEEYKDAK